MQEVRAPLPWRERIYLVFEDRRSSRLASYVHKYVTGLIFLSTLAFCLETLPALSSTPEQRRAWHWVETFVIANFTLEYLIRLATCPKPLRFMVQPLNLIDLVAILPYYLELIVYALRADGDPSGFLVGGFAVVREVRLIRLLRLFRLGKHSPQLKLVAMAMVRSWEGMLLLLMLLLISAVFFASLIHFAETTSCVLDRGSGLWVYSSSGTPTPFQNIPSSLWWAVVTISTVGYGDAYPITGLGKSVALVTMIVGLLVIAFPITIIGANLSDVYEEERKKRQARAARRLADLALTDLLDGWSAHRRILTNELAFLEERYDSLRVAQRRTLRVIEALQFHDSED